MSDTADTTGISGENPSTKRGTGLVGYYDIAYPTRSQVFPSEESGFVVNHPGSVIFVGERYQDESIGTFHALVVHTERTRAAGLHPFDAWDYNQDTHDMFCRLFAKSGLAFRRSILDRFFPSNTDVLWISDLALQPSHRGRNLGLAVVARLIDMLGRGCGLVLLEASPLQFVYDETAEANEELWTTYGLVAFGVQEERAARTLANYWKMLGFEPLDSGKDILALNPRTPRPSLRRLCAALR